MESVMIEIRSESIFDILNIIQKELIKMIF